MGNRDRQLCVNRNVKFSPSALTNTAANSTKAVLHFWLVQGQTLIQINKIMLAHNLSPFAQLETELLQPQTVFYVYIGLYFS